MSHFPDNEECHCDCHRFEGYEHCGPCCKTFPVCKKNIIEFYFAEHLQREHPDYVKNRE